MSIEQAPYRRLLPLSCTLLHAAIDLSARHANGIGPSGRIVAGRAHEFNGSIFTGNTSWWRTDGYVVSTAQDVQKGRQPGRSKRNGESYPSSTVSRWEKARTPLADFFPHPAIPSMLLHHFALSLVFFPAAMTAFGHHTHNCPPARPSAALFDQNNGKNRRAVLKPMITSSI